ncbi:single-stranded DNA-binding protein [uncultured Caudovirales phage]|uniref:Single-stranded DNA-binding protein n=1 Tax=uncultured Caudovirales phage TaxID=2100421 RepID=A0A6J5MZY9_9CAUD|nr:single-stranded DNA-binding protein [uncultured Caudovirales phage]
MNFSVADSQGKEKPTIWWNCGLWGKRAQSLEQHLIKGQSVTVSGNITEREYTDKDGVKRKAQEIRVNEVTLQGGARTSAPSQQKPAAKSAGGGFDDPDLDDIPFITSSFTFDQKTSLEKRMKRYEY